jgi:cytochrome P450
VRDTQGGVARFRVGRQEVVAVTEPGAARELLVERARSFVKTNVIFASGLQPEAAGALLRSADWDEHLAGRRLLHESFRSARVRDHEDVLRSLAGALVDAWPAAEPFPVEQAIGSVAVTALDQVVLGAHVRDPAALYADVRALMDGYRIATSLPREVTALAGPTRRTRRIWARLLERGRELLAGAEPGGAAALVRDALPPEAAAAEIVSIVAAGAETTAAAVSSALWLLAAHPREQEALRAAVAGGRGREHARAVLLEALRLCPPSWYVGRRALVDERLAGEPVAAGTVVLAVVALLQRDPGAWERPDGFVPAWWLGGVSESPAAFLPFGLGLRRCIGEHLALAEGVAFLTSLAGRGRVLPLPGEAPAPHAGATLRVPGLRLRLEPCPPGTLLP